MKRYNISGHDDVEEAVDGELVKADDVKELLDTLNEYLKHGSIDGNPHRQALRTKLKDLASF